MAETARFKCLRCGREWEGPYDPDQERVCPNCKSNSVRVIKK